MNIEEILQKFSVIAVVGLSRESSKESYKVATYLKSKGYRIIPINPIAEEILGEKCYKNLLSIPEEIQRLVEIVNIFMRPERLLQTVIEAVELKRRYGNLAVIWMQLGIINDEAAKKASEEDLTVVMDKCMMAEHKRINRQI